MITRNFKNKLLDEVNVRVNEHRIGTDSTVPTVDDNSLVSPIIALDRGIPRIRVNDILNCTIIRSSTDAGGLFKEAGIKDSDDDLLLRIVHVPINTEVNDNTRVIYNYKIFIE